MSFVYFNPNPQNKRVGDCSVRAICKALGRTWTDAFIGLCSEALVFHDMPSSNHVWGNYLHRFGFEQKMLPSICPECVTVSQFAEDHREGRYVLACEGHVVAVVSGDYFDTWDCGNEVVLYYWQKEA